VSAYDVFEQTWSPPMPYLFHRRFGTEDRPLTRSYIRECLVATSQAAHITAAGQPLDWRPHDFRRIFVTDAIRSGLPRTSQPKPADTPLWMPRWDTLRSTPRTSSPITGHSSHAAGPNDPAKNTATSPTKNGTSSSPTSNCGKSRSEHAAATTEPPCAHENACVRCPLLRVDPAQMPRLKGIHANLLDRLREAKEQGWLSEVAAIETTLAAAAQKLASMRDLVTRGGTVHLGMPDMRSAAGRTSADQGSDSKSPRVEPTILSMKPSTAAPADAVVAAFGVTNDPVLLPGGAGGTWRAGRLVLKPVEFLAETLWRAEALTGLPDSTDFRVARPIRALDGAWVVRGWEACQLVAGEPDVSRQDDVLHAGIAFHAAIAHLPRPAFLDLRDDPWAYGDRVAWEELPIRACPAPWTC
jgi:hypothetical protein